MACGKHTALNGTLRAATLTAQPTLRAISRSCAVGGSWLALSGGLVRRHKTAQSARDPREGDREDRNARCGQTDRSFREQGMLAEADLAEPSDAVPQPSHLPAHLLLHGALPATVADLSPPDRCRTTRTIRLASHAGTRTSG